MTAVDAGAAPPARIFAGIGLLSAALIAYELALMQLLSAVQWHHYAFLVLSVAMLGFGASGSLFSLLRDRILAAHRDLLPLLLILCGLLMALCSVAAAQHAADFDPYLLFTTPSHAWHVLWTCILLFLPFLPGALAIIIVFAAYPARIGRLYLWNLGGSGVGGLLAILLPWFLQPASVPGVEAALAVVAAIVLTRKPQPAALLISVAALLFCSWLALQPPALIFSEYKDVSKTLDLPDARIRAEANSPHGFLQIVSAPALRSAPALSLTYTGPIPVRDAVFRNGHMIGMLPPEGKDWGRSLLGRTTQALPFAALHPRSVLLLDGGTGEHIPGALRQGVREVTALFPDRRLNTLLRSELSGAGSTMFDDSRVEIVQDDARAFLAKEGGTWDLVVHPVVSSFGGAAGLHALREDYTLTIEAISAMWDRCSERGAIVVTIWMDHPWRGTLRLPATLAAALEMRGMAVREHLAAIRSWGTMTFMATKQPMTREQVAAVRALCDSLQFDPVLLPGIRAEERQRYHAIADDAYFAMLDSICGPARASFSENYPFRVTPVTDDRPFFSQFLTLRSLPVIRDAAGAQAIPAMELGVLAVLVTVAAVTVLSVLLILVPLLPAWRSGVADAWTFTHFASIGLGYMFVEILLLHRFVLYMGNPIYAGAAVISLLLISSGVGSMLTERIAYHRTALSFAPLSVCLLLVVGAFAVQPIVMATAHLSLALKSLIGALIIVPLGVLMGMPFPLGVTHLHRHAPRRIPWAWAVNGCFSVVSTGVATLAALEFGFSAVTLLAATAYGICTIAALLRMRRIPLSQQS